MERKFIDTIALDGWEIESDTGFVSAKNLFKTVEYDIWIIYTENYQLSCADDHIVFDGTDTEIYVKDLSVGTYIQTKTGLERVLEIVKTDRSEHMYDIEVDSKEHRYYTNSILSHNTTITTCWILWYVLFHPDKKVAVLANKGESARDIIGRIETAYINLPKWIQSEIVSWNKGSFELANGSAVIGAATSSDAVRGRSYSCVTGDTMVTVLDKTDNVYCISIAELSNINSSLKVLTYNGFRNFDSVKITEGHSKVLLIETYSGKELKCTFNHLLRIANGTYKRADELSVDEHLYGNEIISNISITEHNGPVYDLVNVEGGHHYLTNGLVSHNCIFIDECLGGNTVITIRDKSNEISTSVTLKDFYDLLPEQNENKKYCSNYEILTSNGFKDFYGIKKTNKDSIKIIFNDNTEIICSRDHKFYENGIFIKASDLYIGNSLSGKIITSITDNGKQDLYDVLEVADGHHFTANGIESSNCAFVPENIWAKFFTSTWPTISSGKNTRAIFVSTPNGRNHFYDFWIKAKEEKNNFYPMEVNWWDVPGRDETWKKDQLSAMTEEQFMVEYGNSFSATANTLISPDLFSRLEHNIIVPKQSTNSFRIFEEPLKDHIYFGTVDCSSVGEDYSTISIIDITKYPYKQVAVYADNKISDISFPQIIFQLCSKYNDARVLVESNEIGTAILNILYYDIEYEHVLKTFSSGAGASRLGQRTTVKTKSVGCARLKDMIESEMLIVQDKDTFDELRHFTVHGKSFAAEVGYHDDLVMGLVNFAYYASSKEFRYQYDENFSDEYRKEYENKVLEDLAPLPLFGKDLDRPESEDLGWLMK